MRLGRLLWIACVAVAVVAAPSGASPADRSSDASSVEVRRLTVDTRGGLAARFGGRVDVTVRFRVTNTGARSVTPTARIQLESQIGGGTTSAPFAVGALQPGEHTDVVRTAGALLPFGSAHVVVTVRAGDDVTTANASTPVIPWLLGVTVVGVLLAMVGARRLRASRRRVKGGGEPKEVSPWPTGPRVTR